MMEGRGREVGAAQIGIGFDKIILCTGEWSVHCLSFFLCMPGGRDPKSMPSFWSGLYVAHAQRSRRRRVLVSSRVVGRAVGEEWGQ